MPTEIPITSATLPIASTLTTTDSKLSDVQSSTNKTGTAKLLINPNGTVRLMADPKNFPTPGLKDTHKLFAACSESGQMNVYYSPTGHTSEVYLLKPTANSEGKQFLAVPSASGDGNPILESANRNPSVIGLEQVKQNTDKIRPPPLVISASGKETSLPGKNKSLLSAPLVRSDNVGSTSDNICNRSTGILTQNPDKTEFPVTTGATPLMLFSKDSAIKLMTSPTENVNSTLVNKKASSDSSGTVSPADLSPTDSMLTIGDIGNTIAAHLKAAERKQVCNSSVLPVTSKKTFSVFPQQTLQQKTVPQINYIVNNAHSQVAPVNPLNQVSFINPNPSVATNSGPIYILPRAVDGGKPVFVLPTTSTMSPLFNTGLSLPAAQSSTILTNSVKGNASSMIQALIDKRDGSASAPKQSHISLVPPTGLTSVQYRFNANQLLADSGIHSGQIKTNTIQKSTADLNKNNMNSPEVDNVQDNSPLSIRIDSVFSLSATNDDNNPKPTIKKKKKKRGIKLKQYKTVEVIHKVKCKPIYVVLERLQLSNLKVGKNKAVKTKCSEHCRKRTLKYMCGMDLLDCSNPELESELTYVERRKVEICHLSPVKAPKLENPTLNGVALVKEEIKRSDAVQIPDIKRNKENKLAVKIIKPGEIKDKSSYPEPLKLSILTAGNADSTKMYQPSTASVIHYPTSNKQSLIHTVYPYPITKTTTSSNPIIISSSKVTQISNPKYSVIGGTTPTSSNRPHSNLNTNGDKIVQRVTPTSVLGNTVSSNVSKTSNYAFVRPTPNINSLSSTSYTQSTTCAKTDGITTSVKPNSHAVNPTISVKYNTPVSLPNTNTGAASGKYLLVMIDGKSVLISTDNKNVSNKAYVINSAKDGTSVLTPASITYSKVTTTVSDVSSSKPKPVVSASSSGTGIMNLKSIVSADLNSIAPKTQSIYNVAKSQSTNTPIAVSCSPKPTAPFLPQNNSKTAASSPQQSDSGKKRKKTLAERYPLPPGVVIKQEPRTIGYGDEVQQKSEPIIVATSSNQKTNVYNTNILSNVVQSNITKHFMPRSSSTLKNNNTFTPINVTLTPRLVTQQRGRPIVPHPLKIVMPPTVRTIVPSIVNNVAPQIVRINSAAKTVTPGVKTLGSQLIRSLVNTAVHTINPAHSLISPTVTSLVYKNIAPRDSPGPCSASASVSTSAPLLEPTVTFATSFNQQPFTSQVDDIVVFGEDDESRVFYPDSPGPPDLGEPQIRLPSKDTTEKRKQSTETMDCAGVIEDYDTSTVALSEIQLQQDKMPSTSNKAKKTAQELRIEKLKENLREQQKALEAMRQKRAFEEPIDIDDL